MTQTNLFANSNSNSNSTEIKNKLLPSNITYEVKVKILHNIRARIICNDTSLQGLLTFVKSSVVKESHPLFNEVAYTNGDEMFFADRFFSLEVPVQCAVVLHEMFHIVFRHVTRGQKRIASLYNIATDAIINESIGFKYESDSKNANYFYLNKKEVVSLDSVYEECQISKKDQKHFRNWTSESLYEFLIQTLKKNLETQLNNQDSESNSESNSCKNSNSIPQKSSESELEKLEKEVEELLKKLRSKHSLMAGDDIKQNQPNSELEDSNKLGADNTSQIDDFKWTQRFNRAKAQSYSQSNSILGKVNPDVYRAQIPWYMELRKYLVKRCMPTLETSFLKPSRRMSSLKSKNKIFIPGFLNKKGLDRIVVIIDTSGSCFNEEELTMFCSEIESIQKQTNVELALIFADTDVRNEYIVKADNVSLLTKIKQGWIQIKGGGGTNMVTPLIYALKKYKPILSVIASDGYTNFPTASQLKNTNLLWVLNTDVIIPKESGKALYIHPK